MVWYLHGKGRVGFLGGVSIETFRANDRLHKTTKAVRVGVTHGGSSLPSIYIIFFLYYFFPTRTVLL